MGGVISFADRPENIWFVAGWAFRQVLDDVARQHPHDTEMIEKFEQAKLHGGLMLYILEPPLASRVKDAIQRVVNGILKGTIESGITEQLYGDTTTVAQYRGSLQDLLSVLRKSADDVNS